ncbi:MAG: hypothetical protein K2G60_00200 [Oscillospiraceae bacterium]|nr:hypothetical protein [Oscillospiraceae bacterium]
MSKTTNEAKASKKTAKKKSTGFDIMYRVVTAVLAVAVFPIAYFMNLIYYALDWTSTMKLLNNLKDIIGSENLIEGLKNFFLPSSDATEQATEITYDYICLAKLDEFKSLINMASSGENVSIREMLFNNSQLRPLVISLTLFAAVLVLALVILIVSIFKNKPKIIAALAGAGTVLGIISNIVFVTRFANPLVNGTTSLASIIGSDSLILQMLGKVVELRYDNAFFTVLFIMIAILIWSLSVIIVSADDKSEKALRAAKKAERKAKKAQKEAKRAEKKAKKASKMLKEEKKKDETAN